MIKISRMFQNLNISKQYNFYVEDSKNILDSLFLTSIIRKIKFETPTKTVITFIMDEDNKNWNFFKCLKNHILEIGLINSKGELYLKYNIKVHSSFCQPLEVSHKTDEILLGKCIIFNSTL